MPKLASFCVLLLALIVAAGCISGGGGVTNVASLDSLTPEAAGERTGCDEIFGTAFRSDKERQWFTENCSRWPPEAAAAQAPVPSTQSRPPLSGSPQVTGSPQASQQQNQGGDRTDCAQIRGTPYRSDAERRWYIENCAGTPEPASAQGLPQQTDQVSPVIAPPAAPTAASSLIQPTPQPQRVVGCDELIRRGYANARERAYYFDNCR
jgi:hypothetical protein